MGLDVLGDLEGLLFGSDVYAPRGQGLGGFQIFDIEPEGMK